MFVLRFAQIFLFLLPFQFALAPIPGIDLPFSRILGPFLFLSWLAQGLARRRLRIPFDTIMAALSAFIFFSALSILFAERPDWALRRLTFLFSFIPLFPVFSSLLSEYGSRGLRDLLSWFVAGASLASLIGLIQFIAQFPLGTAPVFHLWTGSLLPFFLGPGFGEAVSEYPSLLADIGGRTILRASAFFPDPHISAFYSGLALPIAVALFVGSIRGTDRILSGSAVLLLTLGDLLTFSRGGYIGLLFGLITVLAMLPKKREFFRKAVIIAGFSSVLLACSSFDTPVRSRFLSSFSLEEGSNKGRISLFHEAGIRIIERPQGYGLGNYPLAVKPTAEYREPIYAHDLFLDIATESGIPGAIAFLFAILAVFVRLFRTKRDPLLHAGAVSLAVFFGHALFETPLYSVHVFPALLLFLALPATSDTIEA